MGTPTPGGVWERQRLERRAVPRSARKATTDRWGREIGKRAPDGRVYEACVACRNRSMLRRKTADGDTIWYCESCHYSDSERHGPLV